MATSEHFADSELRCHGTDCGQEGCPINGATQELVDALELFRAAVGQPVLIDDAFRCSHHNGSLGNAVQKSQHVLGRAADVKVAGMTAAQLEAIAHGIPAITGIGRDDHKNYLHIDVRAQDVLSRWCYGENGQQVAYYAPAAAPDESTAV